MEIIDIIITQAKESASVLISQGWTQGGAAYNLGTYHGDQEALEERLGRKADRNERASLEHQIRRILDERMVEPVETWTDGVRACFLVPTKGASDQRWIDCYDGPEVGPDNFESAEVRAAIKEGERRAEETIARWAKQGLAATIAEWDAHD